jgi:hypothetical protein
MGENNLIRKEDVLDSDFFDAYELSSSGFLVYYPNAPVISTVSATSTVTVTTIIQSNQDNHVKVGDKVHLHGTSAADGYYYIATIINDTSFTVTGFITDSTGGFCDYIHPAGSKLLGLDPTGLTNVNATNVQGAIAQLDAAVGGSTSGLTAAQHSVLRQLVHLADGVGGPFEGFTSGAYREITGSYTFPTAITWYTDNTKAAKIVDKTITYGSPVKVPTTIVWNVYEAGEVDILATATDTISYSGVFETSRVRTIVVNETPTGGLTAQTHAMLRQLIHLADGVGGPMEGFASNAYREILPVGAFPTTIIWYVDSSKTQKIVEKDIVYTGAIPHSLTYKVYDTNGTTILATVTDTINYSGVFETSRTRTIV